MQNHPGACCPELLLSLQQIFDAIWSELEAKQSRHTFPWTAQSARFRIAHYILEHLNDAELEVDRIKREVLQKLDQGETA